jgi:hypothetical protein
MRIFWFCIYPTHRFKVGGALDMSGRLQ